MSKISIISSSRMIKILLRLGFCLVRQKGSHAYFQHPDGRTTVVPVHKGEDLGRGLIRAILKDADISVCEYEKLRRES
ncbi:MAG: type II toxin-antitoxin system HicA family toxin [Deltaproteobacteria bacterium]|nr:type II toxin-antitoxin system HicA family toxin [Deltaproteobacteria bacterium]